MRRDRPQPKSKKYQQWVSNIINRNEQNNETTIDGTTNLLKILFRNSQFLAKGDKIQEDSSRSNVITMQ